MCSSRVFCFLFPSVLIFRNIIDYSIGVWTARTWVSWHAVCIWPLGARSLGRPVMFNQKTMIYLTFWLTSHDPRYLSQFKLSYSSTVVLQMTMKRRCSSGTVKINLCTLLWEALRAYSDLLCSQVPVIQEWSNSRLGSVCWDPWLSPIPRLVKGLNYRQQAHRFFSQPSSLHQHC